MLDFDAFHSTPTCRQLTAGLIATCALQHLPAAAQARTETGQAARHFECRVLYIPARAIWSRDLTVEYNSTTLVRVRIDSVVSHGFSHEGTVLSTHLDNERIQVDLRTGVWQSQFRDRAEGEGVCVRKSTP
jgi:transposase InsO family protein